MCFVLANIIFIIENYVSAPEDHELSNIQKELLKQAMTKVKDTVSRLATDHRDLHSTVSKVGKAVDRNFVPDFAATSREDVFASPDKINLINKVICQHFARQGMHDVAEELAKVHKLYNNYHFDFYSSRILELERLHYFIFTGSRYYL